MKLDAVLPSGESLAIEVQVKGNRAEIVIDGRTLSVTFRKLSQWRCAVDAGGRIIDAVVHRAGADHRVIVGGRTYRFRLLDRRVRHTALEEAARGVQSVTAQMPGRVVKILKTVGEVVDKNAGVLVVEAMKMQNEIRSPRSGTVSHVAVKEGQSVAAGQLLFEVK